MNENQLIDRIQELAFSGKEYEEIKTAITNTGSRPEIIKSVTREINDFIVDYQLACQQKSKAVNKMILGFILLIIGIAVTVITYFSSNNQYILAFGSILGGAWILKEGYKKYRRPLKELVPCKNKFKRKGR